MVADVMKRRRTASFLLVLWGLICLSNVVFRHSHRMPDGRIISHVHPYSEFASKCTFPAHHHTQSELHWLDCISNIPFDSFLPVLTFCVPVLQISIQAAYQYSEREIDHAVSVLFLRGPPAAGI